MKYYPSFNEAILLNRLQCMNNYQQLAYGVLITERQLPNFMAFQLETNSGNFTPLNNSVTAAWNWVRNVTVESTQIQSLKSEVDAVIPSTEDYNTTLSTIAQNTCFSVDCLLDFILKKDVKLISQIGSFSIDSIDLYVQEVEQINPLDASRENRILENEYMQRELSQQEYDFSAIQKISCFDESTVKQLANSDTNYGQGNLDLLKII